MTATKPVSRPEPHPQLPAPRVEEVPAGLGERWFCLEGYVEGQPVRASWRAKLTADPPLLDRARMLVARGEELVYADPQVRFEATLDGHPIEVLLTLVRACQGVRVLSVGVGLMSDLSRSC